MTRNLHANTCMGRVMYFTTAGVPRQRTEGRFAARRDCEMFRCLSTNTWLRLRGALVMTRKMRVMTRTLHIGSRAKELNIEVEGDEGSHAS